MNIIKTHPNKHIHNLIEHLEEQYRHRAQFESYEQFADHVWSALLGSSHSDESTAADQDSDTLSWSDYEPIVLRRSRLT